MRTGGALECTEERDPGEQWVVPAEVRGRMSEALADLTGDGRRPSEQPVLKVQERQNR